MASKTLSAIIYSAACSRASHVMGNHELTFDLKDLSTSARPRLTMSLVAAQMKQDTFDSLAVLHSAGAQLCILIDCTETKVPETTIAALGTLNLRIFAIDDTTHSWREIRSDTPTPLHTHLWCLPSDMAISIATVMHSSGLGGAERTHLEFVADVISTGVMVNTIIPEPDLGLGEMLRAAGSSVTTLPAATWWTPNLVLTSTPESKRANYANIQRDLIPRTRMDVIDALHPDVVLTRTLVIPHGAFAAAALGIPHVWDISEFVDRDHGHQLPFSPSQTGHVIETLSDGVIFHSQALRDYFIPLASGFSETKVRVEMATPRIPEEVKIRHRVAQDIRKSNKDPLHPFVVGIVAALHEGKGHADAIQAAALFKQQHKRVEFKFIGQGNPFDENRLTKLIAENKVSDCVHLVGHKKDLDQVYEGLDAVAVTSRSEGLGRVAFEATEFGLPVIYAQSAGLLDYMSSANGIGYTPGDPIALVAAISRLIEDDNLAQQLVSRAQEQFETSRNNPARAQSLHDWLIDVRTNFAPPPLRSLIGQIVSAASLMTPNEEHLATVKRATQLTAELRNALGISVTRQERLEAMTEKFNEAQELIKAMQNSRSWRWTKPFRRKA